MTPANVASGFLAVADAVEARQFAYYGYSWLALSGMQLAIRTGRLSALIMGGFPPIDGPYAEMLRVTMATHEMSISNQNAPKKTSQQETSQASDEFDWSSVEVSMTEAQTRHPPPTTHHPRRYQPAAVWSPHGNSTCPPIDNPEHLFYNPASAIAPRTAPTRVLTNTNNKSPISNL